MAPQYFCVGGHMGASEPPPSFEPLPSPDEVASLPASEDAPSFDEESNGTVASCGAPSPPPSSLPAHVSDSAQSPLVERPQAASPPAETRTTTAAQHATSTDRGDQVRERRKRLARDAGDDGGS
jgi:hypothetical protein